MKFFDKNTILGLRTRRFLRATIASPGGQRQKEGQKIEEKAQPCLI
jgi:hypothetical protein